jgi:hypothetical protein
LAIKNLTKFVTPMLAVSAPGRNVKGKVLEVLSHPPCKCRQQNMWPLGFRRNVNNKIRSIIGVSQHMKL